MLLSALYQIHKFGEKHRWKKTLIKTFPYDYLFYAIIPNMKFTISIHKSSVYYHNQQGIIEVAILPYFHILAIYQQKHSWHGTTKYTKYLLLTYYICTTFIWFANCCIRFAISMVSLLRRRAEENRWFTIQLINSCIS